MRVDSLESEAHAFVGYNSVEYPIVD